MKIMFLIRSLGPGGAERQLTNLAIGLRKLGHDIAIVTFYSGNLLADELTDAGVSVRTLNKRGRWDIARSAVKLLHFVGEERPAILHSYLSTANLLALIPKVFYPSLKVVWGVRASNVDFSAYDWFAKMSFQCECLFSNFADLIISNSIVGHEYHLRHGFPHKQMIVIHNGIDTELFRIDEEGRKRIRAEWKLQDEETLIGHVGRLDPMKGHSTFIEAAALLIKKGNNIRIVCVGEGLSAYGDDGEELRSLASQLGLGKRIIWAGSRRDMPAVYNAFDVAVSSSRWGEGFPNVIVEAMACGIPCVATDVGDSASIIGETGQPIIPDDPEALAIGIESAMKGRDNEKRAILRQRIVQNFTLQMMVRTTETLLSDLIRDIPVVLSRVDQAL
jgi:glycosyltransferase involved in cell wall biosynthesis